MFNRHLQIQVDDKETAVTMACHPKVVKELFIDCTASFDYQLHVRIDDKELQFLSPNVSYDGYHVTFYFEDTAKITVGSRIDITIVFWYKDKMVRNFNGSTNIRRDEISQATEHWTYMEDDQFHIDPDDVPCQEFLDMLKPEWERHNLYHAIEDSENDTIIDVEYMEVKENGAINECRKQIEHRESYNPN